MASPRMYQPSLIDRLGSASNTLVAAGIGLLSQTVGVSAQSQNESSGDGVNLSKGAFAGVIVAAVFFGCCAQKIYQNCRAHARAFGNDDSMFLRMPSAPLTVCCTSPRG